MKKLFLLIAALTASIHSIPTHADYNYQTIGRGVLGSLIAAKGLSVLLKQASSNDESINFRRTSIYNEDESFAWNLTNQANYLIEVVGAAALAVIGTQLAMNNYKNSHALDCTQQDKLTLARAIVGTLCAWKGIDWLLNQPIIYNRSQYSTAWNDYMYVLHGIEPERWSPFDTEDKVMHHISKIGSCGLIALGYHLLTK